MTQMGLDTDSIELLDFDYDVPCDIKIGEDKRDCDRPAEWVITLSCCGKQLMWCQFHFDDILDDIAKGMLFWCPTTIGGCGVKGIQQPIASAERLDKHRKV